ncbi:MAG: hypothetical protein DWP97_08250 [Calditrichaeota bacterium]|nr:MAG: hypothetical protein DWP97_08250 [Calditrichota bacterium]
MFKKIVLLLLLLILLGGVSYYKTIRDKDKIDDVYKQVKSETVRENIQYQNVIDSLNLLIDETKEKMSDASETDSIKFQTEIDSLEQLVTSQAEKITDLQKKQQIAKKTTTKKKPRQLSAHEKIANYYKQRYSDLPKDLSVYEKKIAVSEIRQETIDKFSISTSELNTIRKKYNLSY